MIPFSAICLAGPTACGKTNIALEIAEEFNLAIINADSRQVYEDFPIITAQPTIEEQKKVKHFLYGFLSSNEKINTGKWLEMACNVMHGLKQDHILPLFVGGTGFYFKTLLEGIAAIPHIDNKISNDLFLRLQNEGLEVLYSELCVKDNIYASKIHKNDTQRILRALEVCEGTEHNFTWWHENCEKIPSAKGPFLVILPNLNEITPYIEKRIDSMLKNGAIDEAKKALDKNSCIEMPVWSGIGCAEILSYLKQQISFEDCKKLWIKNTRAYAKRQITWFKYQKNAIFLSLTAKDRIKDLVKEFLDSDKNNLR